MLQMQQARKGTLFINSFDTYMTLPDTIFFYSASIICMSATSLKALIYKHSLHVYMA